MVAELQKIIQDIRLHKNIAETGSYIEEYISTCEGINFPNISHSDNKIDFDLFLTRINETLNSSLKNLPECKKSYLILPSDSNQVMNRLGCTHACPFCSALCWGQYLHHEDDGELKNHHTCHQPMGLSGVSFQNSSILSTEICHDQEINRAWYVETSQLPWCHVIKLDRYKNWKYTLHVNKKFDDLMKWFFLQLNTKIAQRYDRKPATKEDLKLLKISSSDIGQILAEINQKI
jgi:hypothetical protein